MKPNNWNNCESAAAIGRSPKILIDNGHGDPDLEAVFYILRRTLPPAVLVENFFMDSIPDYRFLLSEKGQAAIVNLHIDGICRYVSMAA